MNDQDYTERYRRQLQLTGFGPEGQAKLHNAKVLVVGAGGLGIPALQYLTAMGIGTIGIVDDDVVSLSNLHRQVLYGTADVGKLKVDVAAVKLSEQNPGVNIKPYPTRLDTANAIGIVGEYDMVLDATDNISSRYLINDACVILGKPFVYGAVQRYEGHVSVFNYEGGPTYRCLYPTPPMAHEIPDCNTEGVLGVVPGIVGCRQALQVVKMITGIGKPLSGQLLVFDFLNDEVYKMKLKADPANKLVNKLKEAYELGAGKTVKPEELLKWYEHKHEFVLLDVREADEYAVGNLPGARNIPLSTLEAEPVATDERLPTVLYCQKGGRSAKAAMLLRGQQPSLEVLELAGGMDGWIYNIERP